MVKLIEPFVDLSLVLEDGPGVDETHVLCLSPFRLLLFISESMHCLRFSIKVFAELRHFSLFLLEGVLDEVGIEPCK